MVGTSTEGSSLLGARRVEKSAQRLQQELDKRGLFLNQKSPEERLDAEKDALLNDRSLNREGMITRVSEATQRRLKNVWTGMVFQNDAIIRNHTEPAIKYVRTALENESKNPTELNKLFDKYVETYNAGETHDPIGFMETMLTKIDKKFGRDKN